MWHSQGGQASTRCTRRPHDLCLHRVPGGIPQHTSHHQKQDQPRPDVHPDGRGGPLHAASPTGSARDRRHIQGQGQGIGSKGRSADGHPKVGHSCYTSNSHRGGGQGGHPAHVFRSAQAIRSSPPLSKEVRPTPAPNKIGHFHTRWGHQHESKVGQEHAEGGPNSLHFPQYCPRHQTLPSGDDPVALRPHPNSLVYRPTPNVQGYQRPNPYVSYQRGLGSGHIDSWGRSTSVLVTQPKEGGSHTGTSRRLWRPPCPETGWMEI